MSRRKHDTPEVMYREAREALAEAITLTPRDRLEKAQLKLEALQAAKQEQLSGALRIAQSDQAARHVTARIDALYVDEIIEAEEEIKAAKAEIQTT